VLNISLLDFEMAIFELKISSKKPRKLTKKLNISLLDFKIK